MPVVSTTMAKASEVPFIVERDDSLLHIVQVVDESKVIIPVTGYTATMRVYAESKMETLPLLTLTTAGGNIDVNGPAGQFTINMTNVETGALTWESGWYKFDMTSPGGDVTRIMQGPISVL